MNDTDSPAFFKIASLCRRLISSGFHSGNQGGSCARADNTNTAGCQIYRSFRDSDMHKLAFLGRARALGFTIENCRALLALWEDKSRASADVRTIAKDHLKQIEAKIVDLTAMRTRFPTWFAPAQATNDRTARS